MVFYLEHGKYTAELGRRLRERVRLAGRRDIMVFFDHGKPGESPRIVPYFGKYGRATTQAFVDIAVVDKHAKSVIVLCEVEEEGVNPKKVIGDCCNIFISDSVMVGRAPYDISSARMVLGVKAPQKGDSRDKVSGTLDRIQAIVKEQYRREMVLEPIFAEDNESLVLRLEDRILGIVGI